MTDAALPLVADVFPDLAADVVELLRADDDPLAETIAGLPFYGVCTCSSTCRAAFHLTGGSRLQRRVTRWATTVQTGIGT
ncbi:hypothetical protein SMC26_10325 [Actinomadura fulvescens]|uniref:Uncharacterized protein n=1 Tax=Actinomadura fulvescens TaxID=46160 RepID=A0ABN3Q3D7_9ACTN